ncbi:cohesin domain-containing protein [Pseudoalteromonas luteoviolacea]|uniref:Cohesin domain-containing protein n=1 Tax=Pseudoalteromonas luteoviolacea NCIMB 1942 TaxID=1365253 RepID=A0A167GN98_9GAMM|nr:cohesin domain-containing protein [Pseudoalteromonas luteoviolacea]KZN55842.1 hypothetical protein N482_05030 [Pseudoalteromonas luteoviolacea NCIMB 1942]
MKQLITIFLLLNSFMVVAEQGQTFLSTPEKAIKTGSEFYVDIMTRDVPDVYGVHLTLRFDASQISVIGSTENQEGGLVEHGNFFDNDRLYVLQNQTDSNHGSVSYIVSQIAPAQSVSGNGRIARVFFKAKESATQAAIELVQADFGTKKGEKLTFSKGAPLSFEFSAAYSQAPKAPNDLPFIQITLIALTIIGLIIMVLAFKRRKICFTNRTHNSGLVRNI